jgi:thioredoxin 1
MAVRIGAQEFKEKVLEEQKLSLIEFYSDSCVPCKRMAPVLAELEEDYAEQLFVGKVNIAWEEALINEYQILSAPTILLFNEGKVVERLSGIQKKTVLEDLIKKYL